MTLKNRLLNFNKNMLNQRINLLKIQSICLLQNIKKANLIPAGYPGEFRCRTNEK